MPEPRPYRKPLKATVKAQKPKVQRRPWGTITTLPDGRVRIQVGFTLTEPQQLKWLDQAKQCSKCKEWCWTATPRGRAIHIACDGWLDHLTPEAKATLMAQLIDVLQPVEVVET